MSLRDLERESIRDFLETNANLLTGRVLDYGCGRQPYRSIVENAGGCYFGFDRPSFPGAVIDEEVGDDARDGALGRIDAIICNQVIQYVEDPEEMLRHFKIALSGEGGEKGGWLLMTGPTNWPVVEVEDKWRFTVPAIDELLMFADFSEIETAYRAQVNFEGEAWPLGWWAKARA